MKKIFSLVLLSLAFISVSAFASSSKTPPLPGFYKFTVTNNYLSAGSSGSKNIMVYEVDSVHGAPSEYLGKVEHDQTETYTVPSFEGVILLTADDEQNNICWGGKEYWPGETIFPPKVFVAPVGKTSPGQAWCHFWTYRGSHA